MTKQEAIVHVVATMLYIALVLTFVAYQFTWTLEQIRRKRARTEQKRTKIKLCATCGRPHPDDVSTSHHPNGCTCITSEFHAADGNNQGPGGCIWTRTMRLKPGTNPELERLRTILEYERWKSAHAEPQRKQ